MESTSSIKDLYKYLEFNSNKKITLIPTMGNLHRGHLKLIEKAPANTLKIVSIYINKLQFNDLNETYSFGIAVFDNDGMNVHTRPLDPVALTFK